ncbi:hypothetical protein [Pyruvatibacter mobilis]|uniref:hypothetical protein n=1 Tax=Pyruvatibacter mobilis TaxID=1712261 RepID=UPI003BADA4CF
MTIFTTGRLAALALAGSAVLLSACATQQQRDAAAQTRNQNHTLTVLDRVSEEPAPGVQQTVEVNKPVYKEIIGGLRGARLTAPANGESWSARFEAKEGMELTLFDGGASKQKIYCSTDPFVYNSLSGWNDGCMVDRDGNGTFDEASRLAYDVYTRASRAELTPPVPYEEITLDEPQFSYVMRLYYDGLEPGGRAKFAAIGFVHSGPRAEEKQLGSSIRSTHTATPGANVSMLGVKLVIHEATASSLTYTITEGGFDEVHRLDSRTLGLVRRQVKN